MDEENKADVESEKQKPIEAVDWDRHLNDVIWKEPLFGPFSVPQYVLIVK